MQNISPDEKTDLDAINMINGAISSIIDHHRASFSDNSTTIFGLDLSMLLELEKSLRHPRIIDINLWEYALRNISKYGDTVNIELCVEDLLRGLERFQRIGSAIENA